MKYAQQLKQSNVVTYLLYMWYVEDLLRAYGCDADRLQPLLQAQYTPEELPAACEWYANLCDMMRAEGVTDAGHLQILRNLVLDLTELHGLLLSSPRFPFYNAAYYKVLPFIVELRNKGVDKQEGEIETCFDALYGVMMLRLQKKEVGTSTAHAVKEITTLVGMLNDYYLKNRNGELEGLDE